MHAQVCSLSGNMYPGIFVSSSRPAGVLKAVVFSGKGPCDFLEALIREGPTGVLKGFPREKGGPGIDHPENTLLLPFYRSKANAQEIPNCCTVLLKQFLPSISNLDSARILGEMDFHCQDCHLLDLFGFWPSSSPGFAPTFSGEAARQALRS